MPQILRAFEYVQFNDSKALENSSLLSPKYHPEPWPLDKNKSLTE